METTTKKDYTADAIVTNMGLQIVRRRPTEFLPDLEHAGISHLIIELQDNAFDEATLKGAGGCVDVMICVDQKRKTFQCVVTDNGRGIPLEKLMASFTVPHTSGKYDTDVYTYSSGLFGVGAKVSAGLSNRFRAITCRGKEGSASVLINKGEHDAAARREKNAPVHGVTVILEPDSTMFTGVETYTTDGWPALLERIRKYAYFHQAKIRFLMTEQPIADAVWTASNAEAISICRQHIDAANVIFDSHNFNREEWVRKYFNINRAFTWSHIVQRAADKVSSMAFTVQLFFSDTEHNAGRFGMINAVPIDAPASNHISEVMVSITNSLAKRIQKKEVRKFFIEQYKLPLHIAVEVKYEGAQFSGTTKHSFINAAFREEYGGYLTSHFSRSSGAAALDGLYDLIADDIEQRYVASVSGQTKASHSARGWQELKYGEKFKDCTTTDRTRAELFIVEGDSAGSGIRSKRDGETQAIYTIRGKPYNGIKQLTSNDITDAVVSIQSDAIYHDIVKIIGLDIRNPDITKLRFARIIVLCDADADGRHIASTLFGNLYTLCPELVTSGRIQLVIPPYYSVTYTGRGGSKRKQYIVDKISLIHWMTQNAYKPSIDIEVVFSHPDPSNPNKMTTTRTPLNGAEYDGFILQVMKIGEIMQNLAKELVIETHVLEMLSRITQHLDPRWVNAETIKKLLNADRVLYESAGHILTISIGRDDYTVPLHRVTERLYEELLPVMNTIHWRQLETYITFKNHSPDEKAFVSISSLYAILKSFDDLFYVNQLKGIGSGDPQDTYDICMNPAHRTVYPITSMDDVSVIPQLLGKDSEYRKRLLVGKTGT